MKTDRTRYLRQGLTLAMAALVLIAAACTNGEGEATGSVDRSPIPTPLGGVNRQNCETIALTDYFLSDDEKTWYTENCNRMDCAAIRGTEYLTPQERNWFLDKCR